MNHSSRRAQSLIVAQFNPTIKTYIYVMGIILCVITMIGIVLLPFWLILGKLYINKYFENLHCELTSRALHYKKGVWFKVERTIPLDKIQDLTFVEGPVLRWLNMSTLKVETAGQSAQQSADLSLTGIMDALSFREAVLNQRDDITDVSRPASGDGSSSISGNDVVLILSQIRDSLKSIDQKLNR
jgi:putative membrane protein